MGRAAPPRTMKSRPAPDPSLTRPSPKGRGSEGAARTSFKGCQGGTIYRSRAVGTSRGRHGPRPLPARPGASDPPGAPGHAVRDRPGDETDSVSHHEPNPRLTGCQGMSPNHGTRTLRPPPLRAPTIAAPGPRRRTPGPRRRLGSGIGRRPVPDQQARQDASAPPGTARGRERRPRPLQASSMGTGAYHCPPANPRSDRPAGRPWAARSAVRRTLLGAEPLRRRTPPAGQGPGNTAAPASTSTAAGQGRAVVRAMQCPPGDRRAALSADLDPASHRS